MALPELNDAQKYQIRELQLSIANASIEITNINQKAQADVRAVSQKQQVETVKLRTVIEGIAKAGDVDFSKVTFDLDALKFNEIPVPPTPPAPPAEPPAPATPPAA